MNNAHIEQAWDAMMPKVRGVIASVLGPALAYATEDILAKVHSAFSTDIAFRYDESRWEGVTVTAGRNKAIDFLRPKKNHAASQEQLPDGFRESQRASEPNPEDRAGMQKVWDRLKSCLTEREFRMAELLYLHGMTYSEIARELGISTKTVQRDHETFEAKARAALGNLEDWV